jgi:hypothetical protein
MLDALCIACVAACVILLAVRAAKLDSAAQDSLETPGRAAKPRWASTFQRKPTNEAKLLHGEK